MTEIREFYLTPIGASTKPDNPNLFTSYHMAYYDKKDNMFYVVGCIGFGFGIWFLQKLNNFFQKRVFSVKPKSYENGGFVEPDFWLFPSEIFRVGFGDIGLSKRSFAGRGVIQPDYGFFIRFPRCLEWIRYEDVDMIDREDLLASFRTEYPESDNED